MKELILKGAAWTALFRLADRGLGLISTLILARILFPEDFGLVAMAMVVIAVIELATAFGFEVALIQRATLEPAHYNSAWTMNLALGVGCGLTVAALAWPASLFYSEPRIVAIMLVLACSLVIGGFENIGIVDFRRAMDFRRDFIFLSGKRMAGFCVTVPMALLTQSYWSLIAGTVASRLVGVLLSYLLHPYRPRPGLSAWRELLRFSRWMLLSNLVTAAIQRIPHFVVGRMFGSASLGAYVTAAEFAIIPSSELAAPVNRAAGPGYARLANEPRAFRETFLDIGASVNTVGLPAGLGLAAIAHPLVLVLLGGRWLEAVGYIQLLAMSGVFVTIGSNNGAACVALGHPRLNTWALILRLVVLVPLVLVLAGMYGAIGVAWAEVIAAFVSFLCSSWLACSKIGVTASQFVLRSWRAVVASGVMFFAVRAIVAHISDWQPDGPLFLPLVACIAAGASIYSACLYVLWVASGRPHGIESQVLERGLPLLARLVRRDRR